MTDLDVYQVAAFTSEAFGGNPAAVVPLDACPAGEALEVVCRVNGQERQRGHAGLMVFDFAAIVAAVSAVMTLEPGDLIATGTPEGVGPLTAGDVVEVEVSGVGVLRNAVERER